MSHTKYLPSNPTIFRSKMSKSNQKITIRKYKGIVRIDQVSKGTYGWYVRVIFQGKTKS